MNFLAHAYLARNSIPLIVGNFIADFVKGNQFDNYDEPIAMGIVMHRRIDEFTDSHPVFKKSCNRLRPKYRHYSGVIVDLYYDHFLARNWNDFSDIPLERFAGMIYRLIYEHFEILPEKVKKMLPFMAEQNWLVNYGTIEGIDRTLKGLSRRTNHDSGMEKAVIDLKTHYELFQKEFNLFFPLLVEFSDSI